MKSFQHERGAKQRAAVQRRENAGGEANAKVTRNGSGLETGASRSGPGGAELLRIEKYTLTFAALLSNFSTPCRMSFDFHRGLELTVLLFIRDLVCYVSRPTSTTGRAQRCAHATRWAHEGRHDISIGPRKSDRKLSKCGHCFVCRCVVLVFVDAD